jgi:hypothetical protein
MPVGSRDALASSTLESLDAVHRRKAGAFTSTVTAGQITKVDCEESGFNGAFQEVSGHILGACCLYCVCSIDKFRLFVQTWSLRKK